MFYEQMSRNFKQLIKQCYTVACEIMAIMIVWNLLLHMNWARETLLIRSLAAKNLKNTTSLVSVSDFVQMQHKKYFTG